MEQGKEAQEGKEVSAGLQGFTLLELVVATALLIVLGGAITILFGRGLTAWQRTNGRLEQIFVIEKGLSVWGHELRNAVVLTDPPWVGTKDKITFITAEGATHLGVVSYRLSSQAGGTQQELVREWQPFPVKEGALQRTTVVSEVSAFSLDYGALEQRDGQKSLSWLSEWDMTKQSNQLPKLVRVRIEAKNPRGQITAVAREWWIPSGALGGSPE